MGRLDNKVALITGGARGQGAVETKLFAKEGAKVVFGDVLDDEGRKVEAEVQETGDDATYVHLDVTSDDSWLHAIELAETRYGKLDILINNAAIIRVLTLEETTGEVWDRIMEVNAKGVFLGTKYAIPSMRKVGGGSIVNISSVEGIVGRRHTTPAYGSSKGAVRVFTKATAIQYAVENIRCNSVHPGPVDTPMLRSVVTDAASRERLSDEVPLGRMGTSEEIAYGVLYLASDEASWVTGAELVIDGGMTAQ
jgi:cyclopentanol dehydrogenase